MPNGLVPRPAAGPRARRAPAPPRDLDNTLGRPTGDGTVAFTAPASLSSGVGVRYVLLGSAIGGRVLAPLLEERIGLPPGRGTAFFRRAGQSPAADWRTFRRAVAAHESTLDADAALHAARLTFETIRSVPPG